MTLTIYSPLSEFFIYGFGPYLEFETNITADIIGQLSKTEDVSVHVFDVAFDRQMFLAELKNLNPRYVIGLGQSRRAGSLMLETSAKNMMSAEHGATGVPIDSACPFSIPLSLEMPVLEGCVLSHDAGTYVCNYSMWVIENWCKENKSKFGFIHVPFNYDVSLATSYLSHLVKDLRNIAGAF